MILREGTILVTGASGQIGSELVPALSARYGTDRVIGSDIRVGTGAEEPLDVTDRAHLMEIVRRHGVGTVFHLAALLSTVAEAKPRVAWQVNMGGLHTVLEVARQVGAAVFFPSSIGAFGPGTPRDATPQDTLQRPTTIYGVTKVSGELLCDYYAARFGVDARGLRLPGLISHAAPPGGGTTDYAVEIFRSAIRCRRYTCYVGPDTRLPMMYMPDAIRAMIELMEADPARLTHRNAFNLAAMSFTPAELAVEIARHVPGFEIDWAPDPKRQAIADSWPRSVDDSCARAEWGWAPAFDLQATVTDMLGKLRERVRPPH